MAAHKQWGMTPQFNNIPDEIKGIDHWVLWKAVKEPGGRMAKRPYTTRGKLASHSDPKTWSPFEDVRKEFVKGGYDGVGFVVTNAEQKLTIIDLDKCRDEVTGEVETWAQAIVDAADTYTELSPSGTGLHLVTLGDAGAFINHGDQGLEVYTQESRRFMTITGHLPDWPATPVKPHVAAALRDELAPWRPTPRGEGQTTADKVSDSPAEIRRILLSMDLTKHEDYSEWLELGMALHHQFDGSDEGLELWDECSQAMTNYEGRDILDIKWDSFGGGTGTVTLRTWFKRAKDQGVDIRSVTDPNSFPDLSEEDPFEDLGDQGSAAPTSTRGPLGQLLDLDRVLRSAPAESIVQGLIRRGEMMLITGRPKSGKTFYAMHMARCVASGETFFGHKTCVPGSEPKSVLYLAFESQPAIEARMRAWQAAGIEIPSERLHILGHIRERLSPRRAFLEELNMLAKGVKFDVLFVDTFLAASAGADINSTAEVTEINRTLEWIAKTFRCAVVIVHHTPKSGSSNSMGSQALPAEVDSTIVVERGTGEEDKGKGKGRIKGVHTATGDDVRNGPAGGVHEFVLRGVDTGVVDEFGDAENAAYLVEWGGLAKPEDFPEIPDEEKPEVKLSEDAADLKKRILEAIAANGNMDIDSGGWSTVKDEWASHWHPVDGRWGAELMAKRDKDVDNDTRSCLAQLGTEHARKAAKMTLRVVRGGGNRVAAVELHHHQVARVVGEEVQPG